MSKIIKVIEKDDNVITIDLDKRNKKFYNKYSKYSIILLLLLLFFIGGSIILSINKSNDYVLNNPNVNIVFPGGDEIIIDGEIKDEIEEEQNKPLAPEENDNDNNNNIITKPEDAFDDLYNIPDEIIFKTNYLELEDRIITYYSDYTVKIDYKNNDIIERIFPLNNDYGVDDKGNVLSDIKKHKLKVLKTENSNYGTIIHYSDFSSEIIDNDMNIWIGKKENINETFITENKFTYVKEKKEYNTYSVTTFYDNTIVIEDNNNNNKYVVRDINDVILNDYGYVFNYNNESKVIDSKLFENDFKVDYLSDGGAIIYGKNGITSVRKSNSIIVKNNKLIKIKTSDIINVTDKIIKDNKEIIHYNNGIGIIKENDVIIGYVKENNELKYTENNIINKDAIIPLVNIMKPNDEVDVFIFEDGKALIDNHETKFEDSNNVVIKDGVVAIINSNDKNINLANIKVTNNSNNKVKVRIVLVPSKNTTLQNYYHSEIKYRISLIKDIKNINSNLWTQNNNEYILLDDELKSKEEKNYDLAIWLDYENLTNEAMNKIFYGTLKVYSYELIN